MTSATLQRLGFSRWMPFGPSEYSELIKAIPVSMGIYAIRYAPSPPGLKSDIVYIGAACHGYGLMEKIRQHLLPSGDRRSNELRRVSCTFSTEIAFLTTTDALEANALHRQLLDDCSRHNSVPPLNVGEEIEAIGDYVNEGDRTEEEEVMEALHVMNREEEEAERFAEEEQAAYEQLAEEEEEDTWVDAPEDEE